MPDDVELLCRYVEDRSEDAFSELVHRHVNFVYACALRRVGRDAHLAEDVTQSVFVDLARKAALLRGRSMLTGWLFTSTRFAAAKAVRTERRRQAREDKAYTMHEVSHDPAPAPNWELLRPMIDDALEALSQNDREAVLLRFFEERPFPEIGARLSLTDDAARLRVERALEKMRSALARRGVTSTTAALTAAFASQAAVAAPESLATRVIGAAFAGAASRGGAITAMKLFLAMNKISAGIVGGILAVGLITAVLEVRANRALNAEVDALQANVQGLSSAAMIGTPKVKNDDAEELARLRLRIAQLKGRPEGVVDSAMIPREAWRNVGRATPAAALETLMWAHSVHDMDAVADSYAFSEGSKRIIDAWFAGLNENVRAKFGTPERLLAPLLRPLSGDQTDPVVAYQVIDQQGDLGSNDVKIPFWVQLSSGQERQAENGSTEFINSAEGWKKYARGPATEADFEKMVFSQIDPETGDPLPGGTKGSADENRQSPP